MRAVSKICLLVAMTATLSGCSTSFTQALSPYFRLSGATIRISGPANSQLVALKNWMEGLLSDCGRNATLIERDNYVTGHMTNGGVRYYYMSLDSRIICVSQMPTLGRLEFR